MVEDKYRTFWRRVGANMIDGFVFMPLGFFAPFVMRSESLFIIIVWNQINLWSQIIYRVLFHGYKGQTLGKMACQVKVFNLSFRNITMKQAILRDIVPILSNVVFCTYMVLNFNKYTLFLSNKSPDLSSIPKWIYLIGIMGLLWSITEVITMLTNSKRRAIHDYIAGTIVAKTEVSKPNSSKLNITTDFIAGPNTSLRDNMTQLIICVVFGILGIMVFHFININILFGLLAGLFLGIIVSSIYLFIYKLIAHIKAKNV